MQIQNTTNGKYVNTTNLSTYTWKNLKGGKTYSFKVRSYNTEDGKTKYSTWSAVVSATTKEEVKSKVSLKINKNGKNKDSTISSSYVKSNCKIAEATSGRIGQPYGHPRGGWTYVARLKDPKKANIAAKCMEDGAANDHIGYGRGGKHNFMGEYVPEWKELWVAAKKAKWDITKVKKDCRTSCCPAVAVCLRSAGVKVTPGIGCSNANSIKHALQQAGDFKFYSSSKYTNSCKNLYRGDILIKNSPVHAAMVT